MKNSTTWLWTLGLALLAVLGNHLRTPLLFGVDLVWGSTFALLAVLWLGWLPGLLVAAAGGAYTWLLWGHPYALLVLVLEALVVAGLRRRLDYPALVDALFWLLLGAPLVAWLYSTGLGLNAQTVWLVALKQSINGIFNALLASFLVQALHWLPARWRVGNAPLVSVGGILFNAMLAVGLLVGFASLIASSHMSTRDLHADAGVRLEGIARRVEQLSQQSGVSLEAALKGASTLAEVNLAILDERQQPLAWRGEPHLGEAGLVLDYSDIHHDLRVWQKAEEKNPMARWRGGYYQFSMPLAGLPGLRVLVERPARPFIARLEKNQFYLLGLMAVVALFSVLAAWLLSRWLTRSILAIEAISRELPARIMARKTEDIPGSSVVEFDRLRQSLQAMANIMAQNVRELEAVKAGLARQVLERTQDLARREEDLRQSKQLLDSIVEHIPAMVFLKRAEDLRFELFNRAGEQMLGYARADLLGKSDYDFFPLEQADAFVQRDRKVLFSGEVVDTPEEPIRTADGQTRYLHTLKIGLRDERGVPNYLLGMSLDITEQRESRRAMEEFQATLDHTLDSVFMFNTQDQRFFYVNLGACELTGRARAELLQLRPHELLAEASAHGFRARVAPLLYGERSTLTFEGWLRRADGHELPVEVFVQYLALPGGQPRFVMIVRDISERKRIDKMKSEFVSTVSHELRTPLTAINGALGLVVGGAVGPLPEQAGQMLGVAYRNSQRLTALINDLLDMEKLVAGKMSFELRDQPLMPLVEQALESTRAYGAQYQVRYELVERADGVSVHVDGGRLQQVLTNFLSNAAKFSPPGAQVEVRVRPRGDWVRVEVVDHGPGIPREFRGRIFQKFSQADSSDTRQKGGTGLGLAISKELIEHMGGSVGFESEEGRGSIFHVELPRAAAETGSKQKGQA